MSRRKSIVAGRTWRNAALSATLLTAAPPFFITASFALSQEAAIESCRMRVGKPIVMSCMRSGGGSLEACRAQATPAVRSCVMSSLQAANKRVNVAVAAPTEAVPKTAPGRALPVGFVAPPRTITDITAILDSEKPDAAKIDKLKADAETKPAAGASRAALAQFYLERGTARGQLGRLADSIADLDKGIEAGRGSATPTLMARLVQLAALQYTSAGDPKKGLELFQRLLRDTANTPGAKGFVHSANRSIASLLIQMGDIAQAEGVMRRSQPAIEEARASGHPAMRAAYAKFGQNWESEIELGKGFILDARGQYGEAEKLYHNAEARKRASIKAMLTSENPPTESALLQAADFITLNSARVKARQGRLAEAEVDARRALLARLRDQGKYHAATPRFVMGLAGILVEEGRHADAERLLRVALEINQTTGVPGDSPSTVQVLSQLGGVLNLQRKGREAFAVYTQIDKAIANWEPQRRQVYELNGSRIISLYNSGQFEAGIKAAEQMVKSQIARVGDAHVDTAAARGTLAIGLARAGRDDEAIQEFRAAVPTLMASRENADDDDTTVVAARSQRLQGTVEAYFRILAKQKQPATDIGTETFGLADAVRGSSVQAALAASSARSAVKDPALAELVRKDQDLSKQIGAQLGTLNNVLSLSSAERDDKVVQSINASIAVLRSERVKARQEINRRFPAYADLVSPRAPTVEEIRQTLSPDEAMLSFYFGQDSSFVWAVPKSGPVAFATIAASGGDIQSKVRKLREALEPQAAMISDIPAFDVTLGYELYSLLLRPVESGWKQAKKLIVVTNGALGLLPLSLLPTAPATMKTDESVLFASYREVPWLARTHAVSIVPSAAALRTLRRLPPGRPDRSGLIAFGDPYFSIEQQAEAEQVDAKIRVADGSEPNATRGVPLKRRNAPKLDGVDSAELALLPRLPDTAEELRSIALTLQADPSKVLNLGTAATEKAVKTVNLSGFKIIAFATHGLVPGELNGLTQPALALSSPAVTGEEGDGLLTMEEILSLKLDADWVILSACNTGAGAGAGAEAASGLGRAFFYAGTRALLVTNWSVHSQSARELMTDLFKRQADDPKLARAEAERQAMMALADGPGYVTAEGKTEFVYGHPLFWAPYSIIGDGGHGDH
jgi:CHAT domain-containing protein/tetratricopeptide (TPR) repeat protein